MIVPSMGAEKDKVKGGHRDLFTAHGCRLQHRAFLRLIVAKMRINAYEKFLPTADAIYPTAGAHLEVGRHSVCESCVYW